MIWSSRKALSQTKLCCPGHFHYGVRPGVGQPGLQSRQHVLGASFYWVERATLSCHFHSLGQLWSVTGIQVGSCCFWYLEKFQKLTLMNRGSLEPEPLSLQQLAREEINQAVDGWVGNLKILATEVVDDNYSVGEVLMIWACPPGCAGLIW